MTERVITTTDGQLVHEVVENGKVVSSFVVGDQALGKKELSTEMSSKEDKKSTFKQKSNS